MKLDHWESYYRAGALASCPMGPEPGYTGLVRDAWFLFFSQFGDQARLVDVGTGNGAVALIARDVARASSRSFYIDGIDLAAIDPVRDVRNGAELFAGVTFHPGVAAHAMPFEDGGVQGVCGQYVLEHCEQAPTLAELWRVLAGGGRGQFILHHDASIIVQNAHESLAHARQLHHSDIFNELRKFCALERTDVQQAQQTWPQLVEKAFTLRKIAESSSGSLLLRATMDSFRRLFEQRKSIDDAALDGYLKGMERELDASIERLKDLVSINVSEQRMSELADALRTLGFANVDYQPQQHGSGFLVGWRLTFEKPG